MDYFLTRKTQTKKGNKTRVKVRSFEESSQRECQTTNVLYSKTKRKKRSKKSRKIFQK